MKKRVRIGVRVKLPFGIFPHAGIFVVHLQALDVDKIGAAFAIIKETLTSVGQTTLANRFVFEVS